MAGREDAGILFNDLRQRIENGQAVAIIGAGVSMAATGGKSVAAWGGLLQDGLERCLEVVIPKPSRKTAGIIRQEIKSGEVGNILSAAEKITRLLEGQGGEFSLWLRQTVGDLQVQDPEVLQALIGLQIPIVTTNYDDLIEDVARQPAITWRQKKKVERWLRGDESGILHIHGHWEDPESVIFGTRSYDTILKDPFAQEIMRTLRMTKTLVFIGYGGGLEDPNFSLLFKWARDILSESEYRLYRLILQKDVGAVEKAIVSADRLFPISYGEEHGHLPDYLRSLAPARTSKAQANKSGDASDQETLEPRFPGCSSRRHTLEIRNIADLTRSFDKYFRFRWERSSFQYSDSTPIVYWPVRLRQPTPIHAVQCFAAAGLQSLGAEIFLCLDDLGNKDYQASRFFETIKRWLAKVGGDSSSLRERQFSTIISGENAADAWPHVRKWLGDTLYFLDKVLAVSKLVPADESNPVTIEELGNRRPRRLLTPPVVWACLSHIHQQAPNRSILTLSGYDEHPLWQAWRECVDTGPPTGHLYIPELIQPSSIHGEQAVHMARTPLGWESRDDISRSLTGHLSSIGSSADWKAPGRIIPWCMAGCISLPDFVAGGLTTITTHEIQPEAAPNALVEPLVDALEGWLLSHD